MDRTEHINLVKSVLVRAEMAASYSGMPLSEQAFSSELIEDLASLIAPNDPDEASYWRDELLKLLLFLERLRHRAYVHDELDAYIKAATLDGKGTVSHATALTHLEAYSDSMHDRQR
jgi:hypothetical protein